MQESKYLSNIIYPVDLERSTENTLLVGWNVEQFHCLIAASIPKRLATSSSLSALLAKVYTDPNYLLSKGRIALGVPQYPPLVLGELLVNDVGETTVNSPHQQSTIWITLLLDEKEARRSTINEFVLRNHRPDNSGTRIKLKSIFSVGCKYHPSSYLISYRRPTTDLLECISPGVSNNGIQSILQTLPNTSKSGSKLNMDTISHFINASYDLNKFVSIYAEFDGNSLRTRSWFSTLEQLIIRLLGAPCLLAFWTARVVQQRVSTVVPFLSWWYRHFTWANMVTLSVTMKRPSASPSHTHISPQADIITIHELSFSIFALYNRCRLVHESLRNTAALALTWNLSARGRKLLWLEIAGAIVEMVVDTLMGIIVGYFLLKHSKSFTRLAPQWTSFLVQRSLLDTITWFNNSPGGVKLNPMITQKMGALVRFLIRIATMYYRASHFLLLPACHLIACLGAAGFSIQIGMMIDTFRIVTWPANLSHMLFSSLFGFMIRLLHSLWLLFRGQKQNVLRDRVDTCEYDPSALSFGIMLFSIMVFALPNFAAYHYLFVALRLAIVAILFTFWQVNILVQKFPLVPLSCKILRPTLLNEKSYMHLLLVREEAVSVAQGSGTSPQFSAENFENFLHDLSPKFGSLSKKKMSSRQQQKSRQQLQSMQNTSFATSSTATNSPSAVDFGQSPLSPSSIYTFDTSDIHRSHPHASVNHTSTHLLQSSLRRGHKYRYTTHHAPASALSIPSHVHFNADVDEDDDHSSTRLLLGDFPDTPADLIIREDGREPEDDDVAPTSPIFHPVSIQDAPRKAQMASYSLRSPDDRSGQSSLLSTPPSHSSTGTDRWQLSSSRLSTTYIALQQKTYPWLSVFRGYHQWWITFLWERKAMIRLFRKIWRSHPIYLRILKTSLDAMHSHDAELDAVCLANARKFYVQFFNNQQAERDHHAFWMSSSSAVVSEATSPTSPTSSEQASLLARPRIAVSRDQPPASLTTVTAQGIHYILSNANTSIRVPYKTRDIISFYWQMLEIASRRWDETFMSLKLQQQQHQSRVHHDAGSGVHAPGGIAGGPPGLERNVDTADVTGNNISDSSVSVGAGRIAESVNLSQVSLSRRLLLLVLLTVAATSLLSLAGLAVFAYLCTQSRVAGPKIQPVSAATIVSSPSVTIQPPVISIMTTRALLREDASVSKGMWISLPWMQTLVHSAFSLSSPAVVDASAIKRLGAVLGFPSDNFREDNDSTRQF